MYSPRLIRTGTLFARVLAVLAAALCVRAGDAQCTNWQEVRSALPSARMGMAMTPGVGGRPFFFGGSTEEIGPRYSGAWSYEKQGWVQVVPSSPEVPATVRYGPCAAFDEARQRVVAFGGWDTSTLSDTWEWDGSAWTQRTPVLTPPSRTLASMAYDPERHRCVMFGGEVVGAGATLRGDTWEWDGAAWTLAATGGPAPRYGAAMTYDGARGRTVLFGGRGGSSNFADTWEWDGSSWTQVQGPGPSARRSATLTYDPVRSCSVLFGGGTGQYGTTSNSETWLYQNGGWTLAASDGPPARFAHGAAFNAATGRVQIFGGGADANTPLQDTWEWDGAAWMPVNEEPIARRFHATVFDSSRQRVLLFGGYGNYSELGDTWEWDGDTWSLRSQAGPSARHLHAMAYDPVRHRTVLFGGSQSISYGSPSVGDTWEWDGAAWTQRNVIGPQARAGHQMIYSPLNGVVLLVGGTASGGGSSTVLHDTWLWDGNQWQLTGAPPIPLYSFQGLAYDPDRQRVVLVGSGPSDVYQFQAWEWDGSAWTLPSTAHFASNGGLGVAFDPVRRRTVVYDTYFVREWDGATWTTRSPRTIAFLRSYVPVGIDLIRQRTVAFGGFDVTHNTILGNTVELDLAGSPPTLAAQPQSVSAPSGSTADFTVAADGEGPFTYQWVQGYSPLTDGLTGPWPLSGMISGATTPTLHLSRFARRPGRTSATFRCYVSNACGGAYSDFATLTVLPCGTPDFDNDGSPGTDQDIQAFFACLAGNCCPTCALNADFNGDGDVGTDADIENFFSVLAGGPC